MDENRLSNENDKENKGKTAHLKLIEKTSIQELSYDAVEISTRGDRTTNKPAGTKFRI